jgi:hypothetical protein
MNRRNPKYLSACLAIVSSMFALQSAAQSLTRVPPEKVKKISASLDKSLLPKGASDFEVERNQVVAAPGITLVPVHFQAEDMSKDAPMMDGSPPMKSYCGLYQLVDGAPAKFLVSKVDENELVVCDELKAIGALAPHATHGDLILIYSAHSPNTNLSEPMILSWDDAQKQYVINEDSSNFVREGGDYGYTVSDIRKLLAPRAAKP